MTKLETEIIKCLKKDVLDPVESTLNREHIEYLQSPDRHKTLLNVIGKANVPGIHYTKKLQDDYLNRYIARPSIPEDKLLTDNSGIRSSSLNRRSNPEDHITDKVNQRLDSISPQKSNPLRNSGILLATNDRLDQTSNQGMNRNLNRSEATLNRAYQGVEPFAHSKFEYSKIRDRGQLGTYNFISHV